MSDADKTEDLEFVNEQDDCGNIDSESVLEEEDLCKRMGEEQALVKGVRPARMTRDAEETHERTQVGIDEGLEGDLEDERGDDGSLPKQLTERRSGSVHYVIAAVVGAILLVVFIWILKRSDENTPADKVNSKRTSRGVVGKLQGKDSSQTNKHNGEGKSGNGEKRGGKPFESDHAGTSGSRVSSAASGTGSGPGGSRAKGLLPANGTGGGNADLRESKESRESGRVAGKGGGGGWVGTPARRAPRNDREKIDHTPSRRMFFEGRWIEGAIKQRRGELLARRAHREVVEYFKKQKDNAQIAPYDSPSTIVTGIEEGRFLIIGKVSALGCRPKSFVAEVQRMGDAKWKIVECYPK